MEFEWDEGKARRNLAKHGVSFEEAATAFRDFLSLTKPDPYHSEEEQRFLLVGESARQRLLVVVHKEEEETIRIISARPATLPERREYERQP